MSTRSKEMILPQKNTYDCINILRSRDWLNRTVWKCDWLSIREIKLFEIIERDWIALCIRFFLFYSNKTWECYYANRSENSIPDGDNGSFVLTDSLFWKYGTSEISYFPLKCRVFFRKCVDEREIKTFICDNYSYKREHVT